MLPGWASRLVHHLDEPGHWFLAEIFSFQPQRTLYVRDWQLGLLQKLLWIGVMLGLLINFFHVQRQHATHFDVSGTITELNWERLSFNGARNRSFDEFPYCNNQSYDYYFPTEQKEKPAPHSYWQDNKIACKQAMFADLVDADGENRIATLMTYEKFSRGVTQSCDVSSACPRQSPQGTVLRGGGGVNGEAFVLREAGKNYSCTCLW